MNASRLLFIFALVATCLRAPAVLADSGITPPEHRRTPDQTFLTFPEWYLVYSPVEFASFVKDRNPSDFPFIGHVRQLWSSYGAVHDATKDAYPFNFGYHVMIMVIGVSTTVEYSIRSAYETVFGRLAELSRTNGLTEEDKFGAWVAQDYVEFIRIEPWYKYDFLDKLKRLWRETTWWGPDAIRKWERKYALSTEYLVKAGYGWFIKRGTQASYDAPLPVTAVLVDRLPDNTETELPEVKILARQPDGTVLVTLPRYQAFSDYSAKLAQRGVRFVEIAGNRSSILLSALAPPGNAPAIPESKVLFSQSILTDPGKRQRLALTLPVASLSIVLESLREQRLELEHIYDY